MTSTIALTNATLPYALEIADKGVVRAARENPEIAEGINIIAGKVTYAGVAEAFGLKHTPLAKVMANRKK
jgi:alanine dehydrogenase